ncbi:hypothetical protein F8388_014186 [Cannabis sativa]|uniref:poly(A)-specific ribonuclease n=1 Tax=Cannabis sativa TaxID=3483 RepID=A0A7J6GL78_CANSA|nr:hypothetical protein F8388_014186 [Cannabis sativa]
MCIVDLLPQLPPEKSQRPVVIRSVWEYNLQSEFKLIRSAIDDYPLISMDTEFSGVVIQPSVDTTLRTSQAIAHYEVLKANVDRLNLIQIDSCTVTSTTASEASSGSFSSAADLLLRSLCPNLLVLHEI